MDAHDHYNNATQNERYIARWIGELSPGNRADAGAFDTLKLGQGAASSTRKNYAQSLRRLDQATNGKPWRTLDAADASLFLAGLRRQGYKETTIRTDAAYVKSFLAWARNEARLPPQMVLAFRLRRSRTLTVRPVLTEDDERKLLAACLHTRDQAVVGLLIEGGFRLGELVNLDVGSVAFDDRGGAWLTLPALQEGLKTGPRRVYVTKYAALLHAFLSLHPTRDQPNSPLIYSLDNEQKPRPTTRLTRENAWKLLQRVRLASGLGHFRPHDLRHTSATRFSEAGANLLDLCERYGWSPSSREAATYVHHSDEHKERVARLAAGIDPNGRALDTADETQQKLGQLRRLWAELIGTELPERAR